MNQEWKSKAGDFLPGSNLTVLPHWERKAQPAYKCAEVSTPGRLHFAVFDFLQMAPGLGGGGIGISTSTVAHQIVVSRTNPGEGGCDVPSGLHMLELFKRTVGYERNDIRVTRVRSIQHKHSGYGSNVSYNTATVAGLNAFFGCPLSPQDIWEMITRNYVENAKDGSRVYFGLETGVGEACLLFGGLVFIDEKHGNGRFLGNLTSENIWVTTAVGNYETLSTKTLRAHGHGADMSGTTEASFIGNWQKWQEVNGARWRNFIETKLRPALYRNDLFGFLQHGWELNTMNNMKILQDQFRADVMDEFNETMQREGALYAGMSSAGPGFYAFSDSEANGKRLARVMEQRFGKYMGATVVARAGQKLSIELTLPDHVPHVARSHGEVELPALV